MSKSNTLRRLSFEGLETRAMMAGDVTARLVGGNLIIRGDALDNRITIERTEAGEIRVLGDAFTYVNGDTAPVIFSRVPRNIEIRTGGGDDRIVINNIRINRDLRMDTGDGNDTVLIHRTKIAQSLIVRTEKGHDIVNFVDSKLNDRSRIVTGAGDDVITVEPSKLRDELFVDAGRGDDTIFIAPDAPEDFLSVRGGAGEDTITRESISANFDFRNGAQGWEAGFSDYRAGEEEFFELEAGIRPLPAELGPGTGFYIQGANHSDDLFMFLKRQLGTAEGIEANQAYEVRLTVVFGTNVPTGCAGIGGAPGESVFMKAGASSQEPEAIANEEGFLNLNVDKGNQATGGSAASIVGNVANGIPCDDVVGGDEETPPPYVSVSRVHVHEFFAQADANGNLWLLVGTDSGFEGTTALYYQRIEVDLIPVASVPEGRREKQV